MPTKLANTTLYTVAEVAQKLNVTSASIRNYLRHGQLKGKKVMGRWFILEDDLKELMKKLS